MAIVAKRTPSLANESFVNDSLPSPANDRTNAFSQLTTVAIMLL